MCDGKSQLLIRNPLDRYLIDSPMLPEMKKNPKTEPPSILPPGEGTWKPPGIMKAN